MNPPKTTKTLQLTPEDLDKIKKAKEKSAGVQVSPEWLFVARFGYYYGWAGVEAIMNNEINFETANILLKGADKEHASRIIDLANAVYGANVASTSKKGGNVLKKAMAGYAKEAKANL